MRLGIPREGIIFAIIVAMIGGAAQGLMPYVVAWFVGSAATSGPVKAAPAPVQHICDQPSSAFDNNINAKARRKVHGDSHFERRCQ